MPDGPYDQIILFGDSITEWSTYVFNGGFAFQPALQQMYSRRFDVVNRGFSGYNTAHAINVLPRFMPDLRQARVQLLMIFFGANDSCTPENPSRQHVPLNEYRENLKAIINHPAVTAHKSKILLIIPSPIDELALEENGFDKGGRTAESTRQYADACRKVAREECVPYCDLWTVFMEEACQGKEIEEPMPGDRRAPRNDVLRKLLADGLHFRPAAYELMFKAVKTTILQSFPELDPVRMPPRFPPWPEAAK